MAAAAVRFLPDAIVVDPRSPLASLVSLEHDQVGTSCLLLSMSFPEAALFIALAELARCALHSKACNGVCNWVDGRMAHVVLSSKIIRVWHSGHSLIWSPLHHRSLIWTSARPLSGPCMHGVSGRCLGRVDCSLRRPYHGMPLPPPCDE
jgi:hypothetical protein